MRKGNDNIAMFVLQMSATLKWLITNIFMPADTHLERK